MESDGSFDISQQPLFFNNLISAVHLYKSLDTFIIFLLFGILEGILFWYCTKMKNTLPEVNYFFMITSLMMLKYSTGWLTFNSKT